MQGIQTPLLVGCIVLNRYIVERMLGKGGFGAVYLVRDKRVKSNMFALKEVIEPGKRELEDFMFEGAVLARLDHPALPRVYRTIEDEKNVRAYMLMDYVEGPNLEVLRKKQPEHRFSVARTVKIMTPLIDAVNYLHRQHPPIIHRDIKPANIIVPETEDASVLVDFGIAKEFDEDSTTAVVRRCSPGYAAPEQYAKGTDTRTDIYALAATCYTLITGQVPTDALYRITSLGSQVADPLMPVKELVPTVPQHVSDAISKAMSINSNERFATVEEFWQAILAQAIEEEAPAPVPVVLPAHYSYPATPNTEDVSTTRPGAHMPLRKRSALVLLLAALVVVALLLGVVFGSGLFPLRQASVHSSPTTPAGVVHSTPTSLPTSGPTAVPSSQPTLSPSPQPTAPPSGVYPVVKAAYNGAIVDRFTTPPISTSMALSQVQQQGASIRGNFLVGPGLQGNGPFNGTVSASRAVQFTVTGTFGHLPLLFQGTVQANGSMSGSYCSYRNNQCDQTAGGYGSWNVAP